jgi:hypothetical protein
VGLHPFSLPRAVNDSLPAQIFGIRMSQTARCRRLLDIGLRIGAVGHQATLDAQVCLPGSGRSVIGQKTKPALNYNESFKGKAWAIGQLERTP